MASGARLEIGRQVQKAKQELLQRELLVRTRRGGLRAGPDRFALTWVDISNFTGLEMLPSEYWRGAWRKLDPLHVTQRDHDSAARNRSVPPHGTDGASPVPPHGTVDASLPTNSPNSPVPHGGNNETCLPWGSSSPRSAGGPTRVVGRPGRSGTNRGAWEGPARGRLTGHQTLSYDIPKGRAVFRLAIEASVRPAMA